MSNSNKTDGRDRRFVIDTVMSWVRSVLIVGTAMFLGGYVAMIVLSGKSVSGRTAWIIIMASAGTLALGALVYLRRHPDISVRKDDRSIQR